MFVKYFVLDGVLDENCEGDEFMDSSKSIWRGDSKALAGVL